MPAVLLTKGNKSVCVVKYAHSVSPLVYRLDEREEHGLRFYGKFHRFELALNQDLPLQEQPYGILGSSSDLSGRMFGAISSKAKPLSCSGKGLMKLEQPIYSLIGEYHEKELKKTLEGYTLESRDLPYAVISTSATGVGDSGDDLYLNTLFFMTRGYGILTEMYALAGRSDEDCCSPEFHYKASKVRLDSKSPIRRIQQKDIVPEAAIVNWNVSASPSITKELEVGFNEGLESIKDFDLLIDKLFLTLSPEKVLKH